MEKWLIISIIVLLSGCNFSISKRIYRKGWHIEANLVNSKQKTLQRRNFSQIADHQERQNAASNDIYEEEIIPISEKNKIIEVAASKPGESLKKKRKNECRLSVVKKTTEVYYKKALKDTLTKSERNNPEDRQSRLSIFKTFWYFISNYGYFYALNNPEASFKKGTPQHRYLMFVLIFWIGLSVLVFLSGTLFLSSLFFILPLLSILFHDKIKPLLGNKSDKKWVWMIFTTFFLILSEIGVAVELGRNVLTHLLTFLGFYMGLGIVVGLFYKKSRFNFSDLFLIGGLLGVFIEQSFAGIYLLLSLNIVGFIVFAWWVFPVYGFYLATTYLMFYEELKRDKPETTHQKNNRFWKRLFLFITTPLLILISGIGITTILNKLNIDQYND